MFKQLTKRYLTILFFGCFACVVFKSEVVGISNLPAKPVYQQNNSPYQPASTKLHDLIHTKLEVKFDWDTQQLHGIATIQVKPHFYPQKQLLLDARDLIIHSVVLLTNEEKKEAAYTYNNQQINIDLDRLYTKEDAILVEINYTTQSNQQGAKDSFKLGSNQGLCFIHARGTGPNKLQQIWTQGEPNTNSYWFPTIDSPNQRCTQETYITVQDNFKTLSNGTLVYTTLNDDQTRTDYWRMDLPHAPYLFMLAVGEFAEIQDDWNEILFTYYVDPAYEKQALTIFKHTTEMLDFFSDKLDYPYPWPKYSQVIVRDYMVGAMENTTAVVLTENIQGDDRALLDNIDREEIIAHELFHHWFGNLVTCESWGQLTLNEAFATLGSHLWYGHKHGSYERDRLILKSIEHYLKEAQLRQVSVIRDHYISPIEMFDSHSYHKGVLILHMLKTYLGEEAFLQSLSQYLKKYAFSSTDIHQLRKVFEEVSGQDLNWFFNQWFLAPGHPILQTEHTYANDKLVLKVWQKQSAPSPIYRLPVAVDVWVKGVKERHHITIDKPYQEFSWSVSQRPELVYIDRNSLLVAELKHPQTTTQAYRYLYSHYEDFFAKYEVINYFNTAKIDRFDYEDFFKEVLEDDSYWMFKIMAIEAFEGYHQQGKYHTIIENILTDLTIQDAHSWVREAAINTLSSLPNPDSYLDVYEKSLADSSYRVASAALYAYGMYSNEEQGSIKDTILLSFEEYEDIHMITSLAKYYTHIKKTDKYEWLKKKTTDFYTHLGYESLLTYLVDYVCVIGNLAQQEETFVLLEHILKEEKMVRIRSAAYHALQRMPKTKAVKKLLADIKED